MLLLSSVRLPQIAGDVDSLAYLVVLQILVGSEENIYIQMLQ